MKIKFLIPLFVLTAFVIISCKKESGGSGKVSYKINPTNFSASVLSSTKDSHSISEANTITWTSGSISITEIDFEAKKNSEEFKYESKHLVTVDLFNLSPILGSVTIPEGTYDEVELKLDLRKTTTDAIPLLLKGHYTNSNGVVTPIEFSFNEDIKVKVEAENIVVGSADYIGKINLQLNKFLANISISDLTQITKTDGKIIITSTSNAGLYNKIKLNFDFVGDCDFED